MATEYRKRGDNDWMFEAVGPPRFTAIAEERLRLADYDHVINQPGLAEGAVKEVTVAEIHEEFDTAVDRLVEEANAILAKEVEEEAEVYKGLAELGFNSAKTVVEVVKGEEKRRASAEVLAYVKKYQELYPEYKFIDDQEMDRIRVKYGLIQGFPSEFIGAIPKENAKDILACKIAKEDRRYHDTHDLLSYNEYRVNSLRNQTEKSGIHKVVDFLSPKEEKLPNLHLEIIATKDQMRIGRDRYVDPRGRVQYHIKDPDPIVVTPVLGGWLIITKWGAEADIEDFK